MVQEPKEGQQAEDDAVGEFICAPTRSPTDHLSLNTANHKTLTHTTRQDFQEMRDPNHFSIVSHNLHQQSFICIMSQREKKNSLRLRMMRIAFVDKVDFSVTVDADVRDQRESTPLMYRRMRLLRPTKDAEQWSLEAQRDAIERQGRMSEWKS